MVSGSKRYVRLFGFSLENWLKGIVKRGDHGRVFMLSRTLPPSLLRTEFFGGSVAGSAFSHHPGSFRLSFSLCRASEARRNALTITTNTLTSLLAVLFWPASWPYFTDFDSVRTLQASALAGRAYPASRTLFAAYSLLHSLRILSHHHPVTAHSYLICRSIKTSFIRSSMHIAYAPPPLL